jgi:hypothetical protein
VKDVLTVFMPFALLIMTLSGQVDPKASGVETWPFVLPAPGDLFEHPPFRALVLSAEKPEDVIEKAPYRGTGRRYAQLRYGSPGSICLTVVLDQIAPGDVDLYVDANRDRKIDERDLVGDIEGGSGTGRLWRLPLDVALVEGEVTKVIRRAIVFRLEASGRTLSYAAAGYLEGNVVTEGKHRAARRMDGDGNGLMTDAQDRLWIDLNCDGHWDASSEQFLYATILNLEGERYVVRSDLPGTRLTLERLVGTGTVQLVLNKLKATALSATLVGRDGSAFRLSSSELAIVPVGEYRLSTVTAAFDDPQGGQSWTFIFSDNGSWEEPRWYAVVTDQKVAIDAFGALDMRLRVADKRKSVAAGDDVSTQPLLYTGDGLLINVAYRGAPTSPAAQEHMSALTTLFSTDGQTLATAHSGFA